MGGNFLYEQTYLVLQCRMPKTYSSKAKYKVPQNDTCRDLGLLHSIYKLAQGVNFLTYNELFAMGKLIIFVILHQFVEAFNYVYMHLIIWP
jgi:hypothetical protein